MILILMCIDHLQPEIQHDTNHLYGPQSFLIIWPLAGQFPAFMEQKDPLLSS